LWTLAVGTTFSVINSMVIRTSVHRMNSTGLRNACGRDDLPVNDDGNLQWMLTSLHPDPQNPLAPGVRRLIPGRVQALFWTLAVGMIFSARISTLIFCTSSRVLWRTEATHLKSTHLVDACGWNDLLAAEVLDLHAPAPPREINRSC
jgi:hypothetical protein